MTLTDEQLQELQAADLTTRTAKALYDRSREERERSIRRIAAEGGTYREIAEVSGVAYQRVAQIVTGKTKPPTRDANDHLRFACPKCGAEAGEACEGKRSVRAHSERHMVALEAFREQHPELGA